MISIVVPVYNEEESLHAFHKELTATLQKLGKSYEIVFVDDGSRDRSLEILKDLEKKDKSVRIFSFRKNQGKAEALTLGFQKAKGEYIVTLDADLQDKPSEIQKLIEKSEGGWEVVCGWRKDRKDKLAKKLSSKLFNYLTGVIWGLKLHDYNCGLKLYKKEAAKSLRLYGGLHRFIPAIAYHRGFSVTEVAIEHNERQFGKSKFGFSKLWKDIPDIFTMFFLTKYGSRPLHFFGMVGGALFLVGIVLLTYLSILHFQGQAIGRRPLLTLGMLCVLSGFQVFFTGFLADLMINLSHQNQVHENQKEISILRYASDRK